ncbi:MAG: bifunctional methylenetetrahydrofolate dehydrogenase/methenyltetrahydrofolate cyclohydrolase FolD [Planctomycetes bacterium]|nr:bifunctional methylenetetrahydrofolate dehydrogenase/methenyltetrahydrofolate cyclohydrolase FolD [Planctomycetota bacterium]
MTEGARLLDGKATAQAVRAGVAADVARLAERGLQPGLAVVLVGDDPASQVYVRNKDRAASEAGIAVRTLKLAAETSQADLLSEVERLNADPAVHGILVQLPLPSGLDADEVVRTIAPEKDVDGLHPRNVAALVQGARGLRPCTPAGCIELLDRHGYELEGRHVVVVGRSMLVGKPVALLALERNATVTVCHSRTRDLGKVVGDADVLIAAVGRARLIRGEWIRPGAIVLDVGINRGEDGKLVGDVDFAPAAERAGAITPVPGGIGPMTIAMLLKNTVLAAARQAGLTEVLAPAG